MVFSLLVLSLLFALASAVFFAFFVDAYRHVPAKVKVDLRRDPHKRY